jgi:hypothetical protein
MNRRFLGVRFSGPEQTRREGRIDFGSPDYLVCISVCSAHKRAGAASARHSLRALFWGVQAFAEPGQDRAAGTESRAVPDACPLEWK